MQDIKINQRKAFIIELLLQLKDTCCHLGKLCSKIEDCCDEFYADFFEQHKCYIQNDIDKYMLNVEAIRNSGIEITTQINKWYDFARSPAEMAKIGYPIRFLSKKRHFAKNIKKIRNKISELIIENRFIKEQLTVHQHSLEIQAVKEIQKGEDYTAYEQLIKIKDTLLNELKYIISTLPDIHPVEININNIDELLEYISRDTAA